jgi:disulfide bond formation protein DsbB
MNISLSRPVYWFLHLWILAYCGVLLGAFVVQFWEGELPCPLCMLQRYGMLLSTLGPFWIILQANRGRLTAQSYQQGLGLAALGALLGAVVSTRQILLHIMPDDPGYGSTMMLMHLYSWALVTFFISLIAVAGLSILAPVTMSERKAPPGPTPLILRLTIGLFFLTIAANAVMIVFLEGFSWVLPDDPANYRLIDQIRGG